MIGLLSLTMSGAAWAQTGDERDSAPAPAVTEPVEQVEPAEADQTAEAQEEEPISTDRPDFGTSATTVGAGRFQLETGVQLNREDGQHFTTFPTLLRLGVAEHWELRVESDTLNLQNPGVDSFSDILVSSKVTLHDGESTKLGLLLGVNIPVGIQDLRGTVDPQLTFLWDQELGGDWAVGVNVGAAVTEDDDETRFVQFNWAASFSHPITGQLDAYLEAFGEGPDRAGGHQYVGADTGLLYRLNNDLQVDVFYARGLSGFGPEWSVGSGLSARF